MARIDLNEIDKVTKQHNTVHEKVYSTYSLFTADKKYFQIDTYGKADRKIPGKLSQTIQFDEKSAKLLVELLAKEFNMSFHIS